MSPVSGVVEPAATPHGPSRLLAGAIGDGDLELAAGCFARDGCLLTPDATVIHGREEIRSILAQLIAAGSRIAIESSTLLVGGETALLSERWRMHAVGPAGDPFQQRLQAQLVARRVQGGWRLAIAAPWGWAGRA